MNEKIDVLAVIRQMQANSCHFRNGLPVLADHHDGERERELAAIAAIAELIQNAETAEKVIRNLVTAGAHPNWAHYADDLRRAIARVGGA